MTTAHGQHQPCNEAQSSSSDNIHIQRRSKNISRMYGTYHMDSLGWCRVSLRANAVNGAQRQRIYERVSLKSDEATCRSRPLKSDPALMVVLLNHKGKPSWRNVVFNGGRTHQTVKAVIPPRTRQETNHSAAEWIPVSLSFCCLTFIVLVFVSYLRIISCYFFPLAPAISHCYTVPSQSANSHRYSLALYSVNSINTIPHFFPQTLFLHYKTNWFHVPTWYTVHPELSGLPTNYQASSVKVDFLCGTRWYRNVFR